MIVSLAKSVALLAPVKIHNSENLIAVVTLQGRLLVFPAADLPALAKGKGNKLIQIPTPDFAAGTDKVVAITTLAEGASLKLLSGKRTLTLKPADLVNYKGVRAKRGHGLPRGFQRIEQIMSVE